MTLTEKARRLRAFIEKAAESLPDTDALEAVELFPAWAVGVEYAAAARARYDGKLYRCEQAHTSQAGWEPPATPALWTEVAEPGTIPVWRQPTGAQDDYNTGDLVHYPAEDGPVYRCLIDGNVWSPADYPQGWEVVNE